MITFDDMPEDNALLADVEIDFPRLEDDTAGSCPTSMSEVLDYLAMEVPAGNVLTGADLAFARTALVETTKYWIWRFHEPHGDAAYVTVSVGSTGSRTIGYDVDYWHLTPEQLILGDYHQVF